MKVRTLSGRLLSNPVFVSAVIVLVLSIILSALGVRGFRSVPWEGAATGGRFFETFYNTQVTSLPSNWKGPKTPLIATNGLHWFFSDGSIATNTSELSKHVAFLPSEKDTLCYYTKYESTTPDVIKHGSVEIKCRQILPHEYTIKDPREISLDVTCSNGKIDMPPLDPIDATMRILNSHYYFHKRCVVMENAKLRMAGTNIVMELPAAAYTTKVFMLMRPVFVHSLNSMIYQVSYAPTSDYAVGENSPINYNSSTNQVVRIVLKPTLSFKHDGKDHSLSTSTKTIADDAMATHSAMTEQSRMMSSNTMQSAMNGVVQTNYLMLNLYYASPKESLIDTQRKPAQSFTCVFRNPTRGLQPAAGIQLFNKELSVSVSKQANSTTSNTITVSRGTTIGQLENVPLDANVIVTYSLNLVVVVALSPSKNSIQMRRFTSFSAIEVVNAHGSALEAALNDVAKASGLQYDVFSIPNMLHIVLDMGSNL